MDEMTDKELITILIDKYTDLQRIKKANNDTPNEELDYQILDYEYNNTLHRK